MFGAALNVTVPSPLPVGVPFTVTQDALLEADHVHPAPAVTLTEPLPPVAGNVWLPGEMLYVHAAPAWLSVKVCPAAVIVPVLDVVSALGATVKPTIPGPFPDIPVVNVTQETVLTALHAHPLPVETAKEPFSPAALTAWLLADSVAPHSPWKANVFDARLLAEPAAATAVTRASYVTPAGSTSIKERKPTRNLPAESGAGLPRLAVADGCPSPTL